MNKNLILSAAVGYNFQQIEFQQERESGYMATTHQKFVGTGYFDKVMNCITEGQSSVGALSGSTEEEQFTK